LKLRNFMPRMKSRFRNPNVQRSRVTGTTRTVQTFPRTCLANPQDCFFAVVSCVLFSVGPFTVVVTESQTMRRADPALFTPMGIHGWEGSRHAKHALSFAPISTGSAYVPPRSMYYSHETHRSLFLVSIFVRAPSRSCRDTIARQSPLISIS